VAYHGRASTVVVSGTPIRRPSGQCQEPDGPPSYGPTRALDFEVELGFVAGGPPNAVGEPIPVDRAAERIFGFVLVNDWSARDIQAWESLPLGPFLGKSFATSISPWVVPLAALGSRRAAPPLQDPEPLPYLRLEGAWGFDIELTATLRPAGGHPHTIVTTNARGLYWTAPQQLAHAASNGAVVRPGDLFASGTVSGGAPGSQGCLLELTWNGERPIELEDGTARAYLEDGDVVTIVAPGFGEVRGEILPPK
jgi:fumarylacetoacetase